MGMIERAALLTGSLLILAGVGVIYWPAALVLAGVLLVALAVMP